MKVRKRGTPESSGVQHRRPQRGCSHHRSDVSHCWIRGHAGQRKLPRSRSRDRCHDRNHRRQTIPIDFITILGTSAITEQEHGKPSSSRRAITYTPCCRRPRPRAAITQYYYARGYADVRVERSVERVETNNGMRVTFQITEGEPYQIGKILVAGNTLTKEKIVHRNSRSIQTRRTTRQALLEGQQRLYATGLFSRVDIVSLAETQRGVRDLLDSGRRREADPADLRVGYQEFERLRGTLEISHNNLFGP